MKLTKLVMVLVALWCTGNIAAMEQPLLEEIVTSEESSIQQEIVENDPAVPAADNSAKKSVKNPIHSKGEMGDIYLNGFYLQTNDPARIKKFFKGITGTKATLALVVIAVPLGVASTYHNASLDQVNQPNKGKVSSEIKEVYTKILLGARPVVDLIVKIPGYTGALLGPIILGSWGIARILRHIYCKKNDHQFCIDIRTAPASLLKKLLHGCDENFIEHVLRVKHEQEMAVAKRLHTEALYREIVRENNRRKKEMSQKIELLEKEIARLRAEKV